MVLVQEIQKFQSYFRKILKIPKMASLIRRLGSLITLRNATGVVQQRLASSKPPYPPTSGDDLKKPIDKNELDETADPKVSCNLNDSKIFFIQILFKLNLIFKTWLIHGIFYTVRKDLKLP